MAPDVGEAALAHIVEDEARQCLRGMAGQHPPEGVTATIERAQPPMQALGSVA